MRIYPFVKKMIKGYRKIYFKEYEKIEKKEKTKRKLELVEIPSSHKAKIDILYKEEKKVDFYPIVKKYNKILCSAKIYWNFKINNYYYEIKEPEISEDYKKIADKIKEFIETKLDIQFSKIRKIESLDFLSKQISYFVKYFGFKLKEEELINLEYFIERDLLGFEKIDGIIKDNKVQEIIFTSPSSPLIVYHEDFGYITSNIYLSLDESEHLVKKFCTMADLNLEKNLIEIFLENVGKILIFKENERYSFLIRKRNVPFLPTYLYNKNFAPLEFFSYLWLLIDFNSRILVCGDHYSGKTTFLNSISLFLTNKRIFLIEKFNEIEIYEKNLIKINQKEIDEFEKILVSSDFFIIDDLNLKKMIEISKIFEGKIGCLVCLPYSSIANLSKDLEELESKNILENFDLIIFLERIRVGKEIKRRIKKVYEVIKYDNKKNKIFVKKIFELKNGRVEKVGKSFFLKKLSKIQKINVEEIIEEIKRRNFILNWVFQKNIFDPKDFYNVVKAYSISPLKLLASIKAEYEYS